MSSVYSDRQMDGMSAAEQATKAIRYLLQRVGADDRLYHLIGLGSQSFSLLTEAYATLTGSDIEAVRKELSDSKVSRDFGRSA